MNPELIRRVSSLVADVPVSWRRANGGYSVAERWVVMLRSGSTVFVKAGATPNTATFLRQEANVYGSVKASFLPRFIAWEDHETSPLLVLEDLSGAHWPPPWPPGGIDRVLRALADVHAQRPPIELPRASATFAAAVALSAEGSVSSGSSGWGIVRADPAPFLSLGLCSAEWLEAALPDLLAAERGAVIDGESLVHADVRSDNLCFAGDRTLLVDWNWASIGDPLFDVACWLPSLCAEGGPAPDEILPRQPEYAALISGFFSARAGLPPPPGAPGVRVVQLAQLRAALPWVARALHLSVPEAAGEERRS